MQDATIFAIDPGKSGAIAVWHPAARELTIHDMPTLATTKGKSVTDLRALLAILGAVGGRSVALIEQVATMPGQGISSAFTFGRGYGSLEMAAAAGGHEVRYVTPSIWKKHFGLIFPKGTSKPLIKAASRALAQQRFPAMADTFKRVCDDGRAEASLMTIFAMEAL